MEAATLHSEKNQTFFLALQRFISFLIATEVFVNNDEIIPTQIFILASKILLII